MLKAKKIQGALVQFVKCQFVALALVFPSQLEAASQLQEHEFALLEPQGIHQHQPNHQPFWN